MLERCGSCLGKRGGGKVWEWRTKLDVRERHVLNVHYKGSEDRQVCRCTSQICLNTLTCGYWKPIVRAIKACTHVFFRA